MPPEPLPWDRRDFRKHERSDPTRLGAAGGFRWRDLPHQLHPPPPPPPPAHHPYHHHHQQQRWLSDFRSRALPPGHGKQGGWHMYPEEPARGYPPFGSRFNERNLDNENSRPFLTRSDGRYFRNSRENRGSISQKEWKANAEPRASPSGLGKLDNGVNGQKSIENVQTCNNNNDLPDHDKNHSHPDPNFENSCDQSQMKYQLEENGGKADRLDGSNQKVEVENSLGSIDWKPIKWNRSDSLSSQGSGFSHSNSKSTGADSSEMKAELQPKIGVPVQSPSGDATACVKAAVLTPTLSEETCSRKKPRLGWGEGLAKYEKKNVDSPDDGATKDGLVISVNKTENAHALSAKACVKSPKLTILPDDCLPATPSSVGCSSSPGTEERQSIKTAGIDQNGIDQNASNLSCSQSILQHTPCQGPAFNLENLEATSIANLNSYINELLQSDDSSSMDAGIVRSTAMKKLMVWKVDISKAVEMTESEIDSLETEVRSSISESGVGCAHAPLSSPLPGECNSKTCEELVAGPCPMPCASSRIKIIESTANALETELKEDNIDSPGSATSKFVELPSSREDFSLLDTAKSDDCFLKLDVNNSRMVEDSHLNDEVNASDMPTHVDACQPGVSSSRPTEHTDVSLVDIGEDIYNLIVASNRDSANRASELLNKLLPVSQNQSRVSYLQCDPMMIKKAFLKRRQFVQFKEKVTTLKFRASRHFWKDDRVLDSMKMLAKSSKKLDRKFRCMRRGSQRYLPYEMPQFSYPDGIFNVVPESEVRDYVSWLISDSQVKFCRDELKMPALILDEKTKTMSKFISSNGLMEDPCVVEKERSMINPWTPEEMEIFIDRLATFGKDFRKIASFLNLKTTADCVEFYYKNQKSDFFEKARRRDFAKPKKARSTNTYLVASGKRRNCEVNATSLSILASSSASAANVIDGAEIQQNRSSRYFFGGSHRALRIDDGSLHQYTSLDAYNNDDRETLAVDVLAGICGSLSSQAMGSCIASSVDLGDGYQDWRYVRVGSSTRQPLTPEITQNVQGECSDESSEEMEPNDWTDEEKSMFIQALSSYGKDFTMIARVVGTRSRDECKVYFSKARKCLGLDLLHPSHINVALGDVNRGGSDTEGACVVETDSAICSEKSRCKIEDKLPSPDPKLSYESDLVGTISLKPNVNKYENCNGIASQDSVGTLPVIKNSVATECLVEHKPDVDSDVDSEGRNGVNNGSAAALDCKNDVASSDGQVIEADDHDLPNRSSNESENRDLLEVPKEHSETGNEVRRPLLPEDSLKDKVDNGYATSCEMNSQSCSIIEMNYEPQPSANPYRPCADMHSSTQVNVGSPNKADLECFPEEKSGANMLLQRDCSAPTISLPQLSAPTQVSSSAIGSHRVQDELGRESSVSAGDCDQHSGCSSLDHIASSQILRGYPLSVTTMKDWNGNVNCKRPILIRSAPKSDGNFHLNRPSEFYLQKCNSLGNCSSVPEASQNEDHYSRPQSGSSTDLEKPCGSGDVKLFGKLLMSSEQKPVSSVHKSDDSKTQHHQTGTQSSNPKSDKAPFEHEHENCSALKPTEHITIQKLGFCDGKRMQMGFSQLPDSTLLLAKYPDAFGNCGKVVSSNVHSLDCNSVLTTREVNSCNGAVDYQAMRNQEVQPFSVDMKRQQDLYAEMKRGNRFDVVSGMHNIVGRGGGVVGGQSSGVSDPVAVIKMQYAKAEQQFGAHNMIIEDDSWRSKGDVGR